MTAAKKVKKSFMIPAYLDTAINKRLAKEPLKDYTSIVLECIDKALREDGFIGDGEDTK